MINLTALVLTTTVTALTPCSQLLARVEQQLSAWTPAARSVGEDYEAHSYRAVTASGTTVTLYWVAAIGPEIQIRELRGYERLDSCSMNGYVGALLYKRTTK